MARKDKIVEAIRQEASIVIHDKLNDPRLGFVTVTGAEMSDDLRYAKVFFSVLGNNAQRKKTAEALDSAQGFIRRHIAQRINLKFAPEIIFREDRSSEYSARIQEVLEEVKGLSGESAAAPAREKKKRKTRKGRQDEPKKSRRVHKKK